MKTLINKKSIIQLLLLVCVTVGISACKKDNEGGKGAPTISRVRTISKSLVDQNLITTITTYDANGNATSVSYPNTTPQVVALDSTTTDGNLQNMYAIIGTNLGSVTTVSFNGLSVYFNKALGSDSTILVGIPKNTPAGPTQINKLTVVTLNGSVDYKFNILLPPPTVTEVSNYNFSAGSELILTGVSLANVASVELVGTNDKAIIVNKEETQLKITMPASTAISAKLKLVYPSGFSTTTQEFVNLDKAYQLFTDDYQNGFQDASWGDGAAKSTAEHKSGVASLGKKFGAGAWAQLGFGWNNTTNDNYKYLSFYIKGGTKDYSLWISTQASEGGFASFNDYAKINVPANVWTYYKLPISTLQLWKTAATFNQIGWRIQGPDGVDETFYMDDVIFIKGQ